MMKNEYCNNCPYYNGKVECLNKNTHIVEQCGKKYWQEHGIEHDVKYGRSKNVVCVIEYDYQYVMHLLVGEYHRLEKIQITKEEYESFYEWENNITKVNEIKDRKFGCDMCQNAAIIYSPQRCLEKIGLSMKKQAELWKCRECGTIWEYGVYNCRVVGPSYIEHYYDLD